jgi:polyhydroxyalkanoate synthesis regulator phasin
MRNKLCKVAEQPRQDKARQDEPKGVPDSVRTAIERTFAATAEGAAETRERAGAALDEVTKRGREAREAVAGRAQDARESSAGASRRVIDALEGLRLVSRDEVRELSDQIEDLTRRVEELEAKAKVEG